MKYLIKAPGRTGVHLIADFLKGSGHSEYIENNQEVGPFIEVRDGGIVLDHSLTIPNNPNEYTLIISKRRNKKQLLLSHMVAALTGEFRSKATIEDLVDSGQYEPMARLVAGHLLKFFKHYEEIKTLPWANVYEIYMEDILTDPSILCTIVDYEHKPDWSHLESEKALNYKDLFLDAEQALFLAKRICREEGLIDE
jgi:hypothetical protein